MTEDANPDDEVIAGVTVRELMSTLAEILEASAPESMTIDALTSKVFEPLPDGRRYGDPHDDRCWMVMRACSRLSNPRSYGYSGRPKIAIQLGHLVPMQSVQWITREGR